MNEFVKLKNNIQTNIASWALPKEEIPINIKWHDRIDFDEILIKIPEDLEFREVINVEDYEEIDNLLHVYKIKEVPGVINYFGFVVISKYVFNELKSIREIEISFHKNSSIIYEDILYAKIFRPLLEIVDYPKEIIIDDKTSQKLPLELKYVGFGDIIINITGRIKGRLVTKGKSFLYEIIKRLYESDPLQFDEKSKQITVSAEFLAQTTRDILKILDDIPDDEEEIINEIKQKLASDDNVEKTIGEILLSKIEEIVLGMIVDSIEKNPINNIKLSQSKTSVSTVLQAPIEKLELTINYQDIAGNEYSTRVLQINLDATQRAEKGFIINIPIKIEKWEHEPFLNVREMEIEKV